MRKLLPIIALIALITAVIFMARCNKDYDASGHRYSAKCVDGSEQVAGPTSLVCEVDNGQEAQDGKSGAAWWHVLLTWPEGITAWALILTLGVITWQAFLMRQHADHFRELAKETAASAKATQDSARAALGQIEIMKAEKRAKLVIRELDMPELLQPDPIMNGNRALKVQVVVENLGGSRAFNVRAWGMMNIASDLTGDNYDVGIRQRFPLIIDADQQKHFLNVTGLGREFEGVATTSDYAAIPEELAQRIRKGEVFIVASGTLVYEDIFDDTYEAPFHFVWHSFGNDDGGMWLTESYWLHRSPRTRRVRSDKNQQEEEPKAK